MDPFDTLGIPPRFALELTETEQRYRDLSRALHPDKYVGRPASERRMALSKAIEVNEAWRLLRDPARRAEAMFRRAGIEVGETKGAPADPELLMEMMEQREALAEVRGNKDRPGLETLVAGMREREKSVLDRLAAALDAPAPNPDALRSNLPALSELRYVRRFLEEASAAEDELT
ncbi:MAG: Fe-S protein assembly co-chaperone HscB [Deltaproteobacteria bacterium]|nr:Fe-S protein assembly co-chaperone HscB [Deltaproteobacteria bacterium]